jgi:Ca-activated chloride channel family protein
MSWSNPEYFWLLLLIPVYLGYYFWKIYSRKRPSLTFSSIEPVKNLPGNYRVWLSYLTPLLYVAAYTFIVAAIARPQLQNTTVERSAEGIDIVISLDISTSMRAEDIEPNRLEGAKAVAADFISNRLSDRIGINVFARQSFTVVPPTLDYQLVNELLGTVEMGMVEDGTAIGMGIATAINRLKDSNAESKVIILLTDGMNNAGEVDPVTAAELAQTYNIRIYTLGIGSRGTAPYPVDDPIFGRRYQNVQVNIDEEMLQQIADLTGGRYYRATDLNELIQIYDEIDQLEQTEIEEIIYTDYEDLYDTYLLSGLLFLIIGFLNERFFTRSPLFHP